MTKRERMLTAMKLGVPDRVPVAPDFSMMIPCRLSGLPFYDVLYYKKRSLGSLYLEGCARFGTDAWYIYADIGYKTPHTLERTARVERRPDGRLLVHERIETPAGPLDQARMYFPDECDTLVEKAIKHLKEDFPKLKYLFEAPTGYDRSVYDEQVRALGEEGVLAVGIAPPGLHVFHDYFEGSLPAAVVAYYEEPDLFHELCALYERQQMARLDIALSLGVDSVLTGGSGSITLQSPAIWEELSLPALKKITALCRQAGVISGIHSCGKEMHIVKTCARQTDLNYINPLEVPPMGDCSLAECKRLYGDRLCLMGNLHTTQVMLRGSVEKVRLYSLLAIRDAGAGGGFILSTGDQCGRDTPDENIREMVRTAQVYGRYPLNLEAMDEEIARLRRLPGLQDEPC